MEQENGTTPEEVVAEKDWDLMMKPTTVDNIRLKNKWASSLFKEGCPDLWDWLQMMSRFGGNPIDAMILDREEKRDDKKDNFGRSQFVRYTSYHVNLFTERNEYTIVAIPGKSYLGAVASARRPRVGEDWTRGRDLADGNYSVETWYKILADIVAYELVRLGK